MSRDLNPLKKHLKLAHHMTDQELVNAIEDEVIDIAALGLLQRWFPTTIPNDIEKWSEIALEDATAALTALKDAGFSIQIERTTNDAFSN